MSSEVPLRPLSAGISRGAWHSLWEESRPLLGEGGVGGRES